MWKFLLVVVFSCVSTEALQHSCPSTGTVFTSLPRAAPHHCPSTVAERNNTIYILYDVNPPEGFNLRRDVYIRLAVFIRQLQRSKPQFRNIHLVLPPWRRLYHWKSNHIDQQNLPWQAFFDLESLRRYAPVLDFHEFLDDIRAFGVEQNGRIPVHRAFQLMHFEEMFENGVFRDKFEFSAECRREQHLHGNHVLQQPQLVDLQFDCVRFQGSANLLERVFRQALRKLPDDEVKVFAILNAEIVLHDHWGDREFWRARRSMRFAPNLMQIAKDFRQRYLQQSSDSEDEEVRVQRPPMWEMERPNRSARGGPYLCAHLRRGDFVYGREKTTPTLKSAAVQIKAAMQKLNVSLVFLSTDATAFEVTNLKSYLQRSRVVRFSAESLQQKALIKDGGIAIIDQIICSYAKYFLGTYESTFTYRIYEEREILGFAKSATFNTICKIDTQENCSKNTVWSITY